MKKKNKEIFKGKDRYGKKKKKKVGKCCYKRSNKDKRIKSEKKRG
jgi:hypothetical protein